MKKQQFIGTGLNPVPAVMVSCRNKAGEDNIIAIAWVGVVNSSPPMVSISVQPARHSHHMIQETGEFVINVPDVGLTRATDYTGRHSGRDTDKFLDLKLTKLEGEQVKVPLIAECPINLECKVRHVLNLGSHDMFVAEVVQGHISKDMVDEKGALDMKKYQAIAYGGGQYRKVGELIGQAGFSRT